MCKCKDIFKKNQELGFKWFKNGSRIKMLMRIIGFLMFIIFYECVHMGENIAT